MNKTELFLLWQVKMSAVKKAFDLSVIQIKFTVQFLVDLFRFVVEVHLNTPTKFHQTILIVIMILMKFLCFLSFFGAAFFPTLH